MTDSPAPSNPAPPAPARRPKGTPVAGVALALMLAGLGCVIAVQVLAPGSRWLRVGAVVVALGMPLGYMFLVARRAPR